MFLNNHKPITTLLDIDPDYLSERLYDYDSLQQRFPYATIVAEAEKSYPRPIPIDAVRRCILICAKRRSFFRIISRHEITDADFSGAEASFEAKLRKIGWKEPFPWGDLSTLLEDKGEGNQGGVATDWEIVCGFKEGIWVIVL